MSKQQKVRGGGVDLDRKAGEIAAKPVEEQLSNEYLAALMQVAGEVAGVDEDQTILSLAAQSLDGQYDFAEDGHDGQYLFAEDGERRTQELELPELREKHATDYGYEDFESGAAFVQGEGDAHAVHPNDVAQGALGDCYLMAGMLAVARADPEAIADLVHDNGDGTFDVTLYIRETRHGSPRRVVTTIDAQLPTKRTGVPLYAKTGDSSEESEAGGASTELWPALLEKAVAQQKGSYELISGGNIAKGFEFHGASELFTGRREGYFATSGMAEDDALLHIAIALEDQKPVTCDSKSLGDDEELTRKATEVNVYWNHAYAPLEVDLDARTVSLTNPWGSDHVTDLPIADFLTYYRSIRIGA